MIKTGFIIKNLCKKFKIEDDEHIVFSDISLEIPGDKITVILGESGCGKTTLLRILSNLDTSDKGEVSYIDNKHKIKPKVGVVFQESRLMPWLTVKENISFHSKKMDEKDLNKYLSMMKLEKFKNSYPSELSGGMANRVSIARALSYNPDILLMDEPFAALDYFTRRKMQKEVINIHEKTKKGVVFVTHNIDEALAIADKIVMNKKLKKIIGITTSLVLSLCMLTGCSSSKSASSSTSSDASKNQSEKLPKEINVTYVKSPLNVPSILEKNDSLFDKEFKSDNISVKWSEITAGPDQTEALASGDIDFAHCLGGTSALIAASNGVDLKIIGTYSQAPKGFMLVTNDKSIKGPEDLKGKKIGGPKGTILHQVLVAALKEQKMTIKDVNFVDMQIPDAVTALSSGEIDCALVAGPSALQCLNSGSKKVCDGEGLVSGITVIAVNSNFAEKYPDLVKRFMKVHDETLDYMKDNYDDMISKVAKELDISEDDVKSLYEWYDFDDDIDDEEIKALYDTQDFLLENDMQQNKIKIEDYILDVD